MRYDFLWYNIFENKVLIATKRNRKIVHCKNKWEIAHCKNHRADVCKVYVSICGLNDSECTKLYIYRRYDILWYYTIYTLYCTVCCI